MNPRITSSAVTRALVVLPPGLLGLGAAALLTLRAAGLAQRLASWRVDDAVAFTVLAAGALAALWVGLSTVVTTMCLLARVAGRTWRPGERAVQRWAPVVLRRTLAVVVAAGVGLGAAGGAQAATTPDPVTVADLGWVPTGHETSPGDTTSGPTAAPTEAAAATTGPSDLPSAPAPQPTRDVARATGAGTASAVARAVGTGTAPAATHTPTAPTTPSDGTPATGTVVVEAGDTLWSLTARHLGTDVTDAQIAAAWPAWYRANAAAIGPDPDLLHPGQVLVVPATTDGSSR